MTKIVEQERGFMDYLTEIIGWIQIVFTCLLSALIFSFVIYLSRPSTLTLVIGIIFTTLGLIAGIILAVKAWRNKGTINLISRASASPELDDIDNTA